MRRIEPVPLPQYDHAAAYAPSPFHELQPIAMPVITRDGYYDASDAAHAARNFGFSRPYTYREAMEAQAAQAAAPPRAVKSYDVPPTPATLDAMRDIVAAANAALPAPSPAPVPARNRAKAFPLMCAAQALAAVVPVEVVPVETLPVVVPIEAPAVEAPVEEAMAVVVPVAEAPVVAPVEETPAPAPVQTYHPRAAAVRAAARITEITHAGRRGGRDGGKKRARDVAG